MVRNLKPVFTCILTMGLGACGIPVQSLDQRLDDTDRAALEQAAQKALEVNKDGQGLNWANPKTGHVGTVMPTRTYESDSGQPCRDYQQTVTVEGSTKFSTGTRCRRDDSTWAVVRPPSPSYNDDPYWSSYSYDPYRSSYSYYPYYGSPYYRYSFRHSYGYRYGYSYYSPYFRRGYPYYR